MQILVLDDEELIVRGLVMMIEEFGLPATEVTGLLNPEEALEYLAGHEVDLVFVDINMPKVNGIEVIEAVRRRDKATTFVILSGHQEFSYAQSALRLNVLDYLVKPVNAAELEGILHRAFRKTHHLSPEEYHTLFPAQLAQLERAGAKCSPQMLDIIRYIDQNLAGGDISLTALGEHSGLHATYISTLFKKELGINYSQYTNAIKLKRAMKLLAEEEAKPILEIAELLGYTGERQFYRVFKAMLGVTPKQYREQCQQNSG